MVFEGWRDCSKHGLLKGRAYEYFDVEGFCDVLVRELAGQLQLLQGIEESISALESAAEENFWE